MVQNYLKTAFRNIVHQKSSSLLNVAGLTLGITCSLVLFLLVKHLSSYDNFHKNRDRIYRVVTEFDANDGKFHTAGVPTVLPDAFRQDFGEADEVTFLSYRSNALIIIPRNNAVAKKFQEELGVVFAQPNFFKIFDRPLVTGNVARGLDEPKRDLPFWFVMNKWLESFAYRITIGPFVFIFGFVLTLIVAVFTVGYRSFKAAMVNPIRALRYE